MTPKRMVSVNELARYNIGDITYWIILDSESIPVPNDDNIWMIKYPKVLYESGPAKHIWKKSNKFSRIPRINSPDFINIIHILTSELVIKPFMIYDMFRSRDTGEFHYYNEDIDEWADESSLFDTNIAAIREKTRILKLIKKWADK